MPSPLIFKPPCYHRQSSIIAADFDLQSTPIWETYNKNSKQNQNPHLIWERELEWEKERIEMRERERIHHRRRSKPLCHRRWSSNHQAITIDLQSLLPILISNPRRSERPITKIQSKPKPTSNLRERIGVREREDRNERKRENPPLPPLQTTTPSLLLQTTTPSLLLQTTTPLLLISNRRAPTWRWLALTGSPWGLLSLGKPLSFSFSFFG